MTEQQQDWGPAPVAGVVEANTARPGLAVCESGWQQLQSRKEQGRQGEPFLVGMLEKGLVRMWPGPWDGSCPAALSLE